MNILATTLSIIKKFYSAEFRGEYFVLFFMPFVVILFALTTVVYFFPIFIIYFMSITFCWIYLVEKFSFLLKPIRSIAAFFPRCQIVLLTYMVSFLLANLGRLWNDSDYFVKGCMDAFYIFFFGLSILQLLSYLPFLDVLILKLFDGPIGIPIPFF